MCVEKLVPYSILSPKDISVGCPAMGKDEEFDKWIQVIDQYIWQLVGCSIYDLPDYNFSQMFIDGIEPEEAFNSVLEESGLKSVK